MLKVICWFKAVYIKIENSIITNTLLWRKQFYSFNTKDATLQIPSFSFDSSVEDIFTALISGAKLVLIDQAKRLDVDYLKEAMLNNHITNFLITPAFYNVLLDEILMEIKTLRKVVVAGESVHEDIVKKHFNILENVELFNEYGPTENSVCSTIYKFNNESHKILIGKPISNVKIYILNKSLNIMPVGVPGELCI